MNGFPAGNIQNLSKYIILLLYVLFLLHKDRTGNLPVKTFTIAVVSCSYLIAGLRSCEDLFHFKLVRHY